GFGRPSAGTEHGAGRLTQFPGSDGHTHERREVSAAAWARGRTTPHGPAGRTRHGRRRRMGSGRRHTGGLFAHSGSLVTLLRRRIRDRPASSWRHATAATGLS